MDIRETLLIIPGILLGFSFHEYAHAQVAVWLGDPTPRDQGRLSISPIRHISFFGFILVLLAGFGWAKPVEVDINNFKHKKRDDILVSLAGPLMNLIIAVVFLILMKIFYFIPASILSDSLYNTVMDVFDYTVWINVVLFVFNLLPIPPLDGSHIFWGILGMKEKSYYHHIYSKGEFILLVLIITDLMDKIIQPPILGVYHYLGNIFF